MATAVAKKTFSIKQDLASHLDLYKNKSRFVNEALDFYIDYLESTQQYKQKFLEDKIQEALNGEFYEIDSQNHSNKNTIKYVGHSDTLEKNILLAMKD